MTTAPDVDLDHDVLEQLDYDVPCEIVVRRTGIACQSHAEWAVVSVSHCAPVDDPDGRRPVTGLVCKKHLDWVMAGLPVRSAICGHRVDDLRPFILRIEAL